jgi:peptide/nickel transport system substrate-binding protein
MFRLRPFSVCKVLSRNATVLLGISLILSLLLGIGCGPTPTSTPVPTKAAAPTPVPPTVVPTPTGPSGTLRVATPGDFTEIDPQVNLLSLDQAALYVALYDRLVWWSFKGEAVPQLCESWKMLSDTQWEFKLRKGVKFHNGEPFNAEVVKWNFSRKLDSGKPRHAALEELAKCTVEVVDEYTVRITTPQPNPLFLDNIQSFFILPPKYIQQVGDKGFIAKPVGTGPFKFVEWVKDDHMTLEANTEYWAGAPKVKTVIFKPIPEAASRIAALKAGEVDIAMATPPDQAEALAQDARFTVMPFPVNGVAYIQLFPDSPKGGGEPLKDKRIRQALSYAINMDSIIQHIFNGQVKRANSIVNSGAFGYDPNLQPYPYDPAKAKQLLTEAGYANGFSIDFDYGDLGLARQLDVVQAVIADWAQIGVNVKLNIMERAPFTASKLNWTIGPLFLWHFRGFDADYIMYQQVRSGQAWFYYAGWHPEVDQLMDAQHTNMNREERQRILYDFQAMFKEDAAYIPLYEPIELYAVSKRVQALEAEPKQTLFLGKAWLQP